MQRKIPRPCRNLILLIFLFFVSGLLQAQIDFTPGFNYFYHRGIKETSSQGESYNFSHQFHFSFGFRKHWNSERVPFFNPYFGYMDVQQYFASTSRLEANSSFTELSSIKQRGAYLGAGFDIAMGPRSYFVLHPEFILLSSGDQAKTESYSSVSGSNTTVRTKIAYRQDEIGLKQELPVYRFVLNGGFKFAFRRMDFSLMYRVMLAKAYGYEKNVWYKITDLNTGTVSNGASNFHYKTRLNGFGLMFRYYILDWNY